MRVEIPALIVPGRDAAHATSRRAISNILASTSFAV
jgi:hypothetical protein